ncbi:hypothetical protein, partial [Streptomyces afghaniensis]
MARSAARSHEQRPLLYYFGSKDELLLRT